MAIPVIGAIFKSAISLLGGGLAKELRLAYEARKKAETDDDKIAADERIANIKARMDVLIAEQKNADTRFIRPAIAAAFVIYIWKVVVWDKVLGYWTNGSTDPLSDEFMWMMTALFSVYFLVRPWEKRR